MSAMNSDIQMPSIVAKGLSYYAPKRCREECDISNYTSVVESAIEDIEPDSEPELDASVIDMRKLGEDIGRSNLDDLAETLCKRLTWGEMMEFCGGVDDPGANALALQHYCWAKMRVTDKEKSNDIS